jgi:hypothetical protein
MNKLFSMLALAALFSSCASVLPSAQPWARAMFAPDKATHEKTCTNGAYFGISRHELNPNIMLKLQPLTGEMMLQASLAKTYFFCNTIGFIINKRPSEYPIFSTSIFVSEPGLTKAKVQLIVSLEDEKGVEFAQLKPDGLETETDKVWFKFETINDAYKANLDKTASFSIVLTRDGAEEKYKISSNSYPALTSNPRDTSDLNLTNKNPQQNLGQLENALMTRETEVLKLAVGSEQQ